MQAFSKVGRPWATGVRSGVSACDRSRGVRMHAPQRGLAHRARDVRRVFLALFVVMAAVLLAFFTTFVG